MSSSRLTVNLDSIIANYRYLDSLSGTSTHTGATIKADGYGLGALASALACYHAGCRAFFVARLDEAVRLRNGLDDAGISDAHICIFEGASSDDVSVYTEHNLSIVANSERDIDWLARHGRQAPRHFLHIDTAMSRLGLAYHNHDALIEAVKRLPNLAGVMSHLACADTPEHPANQQQSERFQTAIDSLSSYLPASCIYSLANSAGIFLGAPYHHQLTRPGIALTGTPPDDEAMGADGLTPAYCWTADILQIRQISAGETVGYGADFTAKTPMRLATIGAGYADGFPRQLSTTAPPHHVDIAGVSVPLVGRISMDVMVADITALDEQRLVTLSYATLLDRHLTASDMARKTGTIGYEILSTIGARTNRQYNCSVDDILQRLG